MLNRRQINESEITKLKRAARTIERLIKESSEKDDIFVINGVEVDGDAFADVIPTEMLGKKDEYITALIKSGVFEERNTEDKILDAIRNLVTYMDIEDYNLSANDNITDEDIDNGFGDGLVRLKDGFGYAKIWD